MPSAPVPEPLAIVVADDHRLYRVALAGVIGRRPELRLAGEAVDGEDALATIREHRPDVAVVDVQMPGLSGLEVVEAVVREGLATRVLLLTAEIGVVAARDAVRAGAAGCLLKDVDADALCDAILAVGRGETVLTDAPAPALLPRDEPRGRAL